MLQRADGAFISSTRGNLLADNVRSDRQQAGIRANMGERWVCWDRATRCPPLGRVWGVAAVAVLVGLAVVAVRVNRAAAQVIGWRRRLGP